MIQIIALIFLLIGVSGMSFIILKKKHKLGKGEGEISELQTQRILPDLQLKRKINQIPYLKDIKVENWLKKFLLKTKIFFLKCENRIDVWLNRVSYSKKFNDDYWDKVQKR